MNRLTAFREIRERLGEDAENFWRDSHIYRAIDEAVNRWYMDGNWEFYRTIAQTELLEDEGEIEVIDNVDWTKQFNVVIQKQSSDDDSRDMIMPKRISEAEAMVQRRDHQPMGYPAWYYLVQRLESNNVYTPYIRFIPEANEDYDVEFTYYRIPTTALQDADSIDIPHHYAQAAVAYACGSLWLKELNGGQKAQEQFNIYNAILDQAKKAKSNNADDDYLVWGGERPRRYRYRQMQWDDESAHTTRMIPEYLGTPGNLP